MISSIFFVIIGFLFVFGIFKLVQIMVDRANENKYIHIFNEQLNEQKERLPSNDAKVCLDSMKLIMNSEATTFVLGKFGNDRNNRSGQDMILEIGLFMNQCIATLPKEAALDVLTFINQNNNFIRISRLEPELIQDLEYRLKLIGRKPE